MENSVNITKYLMDMFIETGTCGILKDVDKTVSGLLWAYREAVKDISTSGGDILPYINVEEVCNNIDVENASREKAGVWQLECRNARELCTELNRRAAEVGRVLTEYKKHSVGYTEHIDGTIQDKEEPIKAMFRSIVESIPKEDKDCNKTKTMCTDTSKSSAHAELEKAKAVAENRTRSKFMESNINIHKLATDTERSWGVPLVNVVGNRLDRGDHIYLTGASRCGKSKAVEIVCGKRNIPCINLKIDGIQKADDLGKEVFSYGECNTFIRSEFGIILDDIEDRKMQKCVIILQDPTPEEFEIAMSRFKCLMGGENTLSMCGKTYNNQLGNLQFVIVANDRGTDRFFMSDSWNRRFVHIDANKYMQETYEVKHSELVEKLTESDVYTVGLEHYIDCSKVLIDTYNNEVSNKGNKDIDYFAPLMIINVMQEGIEGKHSADWIIDEIESKVVEQVARAVEFNYTEYDIEFTETENYLEGFEV